MRLACFLFAILTEAASQTCFSCASSIAVAHHRLLETSPWRLTSSDPLCKKREQRETANCKQDRCIWINITHQNETGTEVVGVVRDCLEHHRTLERHVNDIAVAKGMNDVGGVCFHQMLRLQRKDFNVSYCACVGDRCNGEKQLNPTGPRRRLRQPSSASLHQILVSMVILAASLEMLFLET